MVINKIIRLLPKNIIKRTYMFILLLNLLEFSYTNTIEIVLTFDNDNNSNNIFLYCDDEINFYGTSNLNVYEINENNENININSKLQLLSNDQKYYCKNIIFYQANKNNQKILIEMVNSPNSIKGFFINSSAISINIKQGSFQNYTDFSYMFYDCIKLISVDLSNISLENAYHMEFLFYNCFNLENIIFPKNEIYSSIYSVSNMFNNCQKLSSIDISNFCFNKTKEMQYFFSNCRNLETIIFPKQLNYVNDSMNGNNMFSECSSLTSIDLTFLKLKSVIDINYMFLNCKKLETIKLNVNLRNTVLDKNGFPILFHIKEKPWAYESKPSSIEDIFKECNSLKYIDLFYSDYDNYKYNYELFRDLNDLEGCLFNAFDININKCSKYMGFYYCGECKNINADEYCIKEIKGNNYTFYYLYE